MMAGFQLWDEGQRLLLIAAAGEGGAGAGNGAGERKVVRLQSI